MNIPLIGTAIEAASQAFKARTSRKRAAETAKAKLAAKKQDNSHELELNDAEWEAIGQSLQGGTWKDEYVTVSFISIINFVIVGAIADAFGYPQLLNGIVTGIVTLKTELELDLNTMLLAIVFAAIGLKLWRQA